MHETESIAIFRQQLELIRDRTKSVIYGYATACYLTGRTGTAKTHTVREELSKSKTRWFEHCARLTPMGLFDLLRQHPTHIIVLDDVPSISKDRAALQIELYPKVVDELS